MDIKYLTPLEVAKRLRVDDYTVRHWIHIGILESESIRQGRRTRYRIKLSTVEAIEQRWKHRVLV